MGKFSSFVRDETGATAIEYSLIASMVAAFIIAALTGFGDAVVDVFGYIETEVLKVVEK